MLRKSEIYKLVNDYIGVDAGYLVGFSYRTHQEFYSQYCDLEIDLSTLPGTTRERFISILGSAGPRDQAKILKGVLEKFPPGQFPVAERERKEQLAAEISAIADRIGNTSAIAGPSLSVTSEVVERAISDAKNLIMTNGATSGVDRVHTAMHGYFKAICEEQGIEYAADSTLVGLFKLLRAKHPAMSVAGPRQQDIDTILKSMTAVLDALNPIRNQASVAHPNKELLAEPEALLVINAAHSIFHYLNSKFS
jgi:hypothetical protein